MVNKKIIGYKFIQKNLKSKNGNHKWRIGKWYKIDEETIKLCKCGFHACYEPIETLDYIYGDRFFIVEARGKIIHKKGDKFVSSEMRLIKELPTSQIFKRFVIWNAKRCLCNYEKVYPNDFRIRDCIKASEDYLDGKIALCELKAAWSAAWSAVESAAESAEWSEVWSARSAARSAMSAAESAAMSAWSAGSAAGLVAGSAWSAGSAAGLVAGTAPRSVAWSAESAARSVAGTVAWSVGSVGSAAESAAESAMAAARSVAWPVGSVGAAAESAARSVANKHLKELIKEYNRDTSENIKSLSKDEIFVFGSNLAGKHNGGAAKLAHDKFKAEYGIGEGLTGKSYAFPTLDENFNNLNLKEIKKSVNKLNKCARENPFKIFLLTKVGCGIAGYREEEIKKLFKNTELNIIKPESW